MGVFVALLPVEGLLGERSSSAHVPWGGGGGALIFKIQSKCQAHLNQTSEMSQKSCENILTTSVSYNL